jgi:transposase
VHARSISAAAIDNVTGELVRTRLVPAHEAVLAWLAGLPGPVKVAYEAGPTGFGLARALAGAQIACTVAAPSKITRAPGDRVKTDARDAVLLARLLRLGELTSVRVPTVAEESARDLVRAREDVRGDLMRARHRASKLLLRHGHVYSGGQTWNAVHHAWLNKITFDLPGTQGAYDAELEAVAFAETRRDRLDEQITAMAADSPFTAVTRRLCCLRGISTLTGFALAVEIGDWDRFTGASIGAFLGLTPTEHSSGSSRRQGGITKAGNTHARRLLVEAAWHHKPAYRVGATLQARWDAAAPAARVRAHQGNLRLHHQWAKFDARGKKHTIATTAIARELAGWCWSLATMPD